MSYCLVRSELGEHDTRRHHTDTSMNTPTHVSLQPDSHKYHLSSVRVSGGNNDRRRAGVSVAKPSKRWFR